VTHLTAPMENLMILNQLFLTKKSFFFFKKKKLLKKFFSSLNGVGLSEGKFYNWKYIEWLFVTSFNVSCRGRNKLECSSLPKQLVLYTTLQVRIY